VSVFVIFAFITMICVKQIGEDCKTFNSISDEFVFCLQLVFDEIILRFRLPERAETKQL